MAPAPRDTAAQVLEAFRDALVREHIVTGAGLERALQHARAAGLDLQDAIVSLGLIDEQTAYRLLADAAHIPSPISRRFNPVRWLGIWCRRVSFIVMKSCLCRSMTRQSGT